MTSKLSAAKTFNRLGLALLVTATVTTLAQFLLGMLSGVLEEHGSAVPDSTWFLWLGTFAPLYLLGIPLGLLLMKKLPVYEGEKIQLGGRNFMIFLLMCFPLMYGGNLLGSFLSMLFSGGNATNGLFTYAFDENPLKMLVMVLLAPLLEEYLFRKQLIDRCSQFGEKAAILFSALMFGLFHMTLYQFFYAFGLGLLFGYVYIRTRRLRYSVAMHMVINFMGSVLTPFLLSNVGLDTIMQMAAGEIDEAALLALLPNMVGFLLYVVALLGLSVAGLVLLIVKAQKLVFLPASEEISKKDSFKTIYCNVGMILFVLLCAVFFVLNLF